MVCVMNTTRSKFDLAQVKAAWNKQVNASPPLTEAWLKAATRELQVRESHAELRTAGQCLLGMALSAAVSVLIFIAGSTGAASLYGQSSLDLLTSSAYFSYIFGDNQ